MRYLGGKSRVGTKFSHIIDEYLTVSGGRFVEPFVGGMNIVGKLRNVKFALLADSHRGLISLYLALQDGWEPPAEISREYYEKLKSERGTDPTSVFVSFACSFGAREWGGYAVDRRWGGQNYAKVGARGLSRKFPITTPHRLLSCSYEELPVIEKPSTYYCDPPYKGTTGYGGEPFDSDAFYEWCDIRASEGHQVLVSEFNAPSHWTQLWASERFVTISKGAVSKTKRTERLFLAGKATHGRETSRQTSFSFPDISPEQWSPT